MTATWIIGIVLNLGVALRLAGAEPRTELLAAYVPPSWFLESGESLSVTAEPDLFWEVENWRLKTPSRPAPGWVRFEDEFGIREREPSPLKASLQSAKYHLDKTVFALDDFVANLEDALKIEYRLSSVGGGTSSRGDRDPWRPMWEDATLKSDVDLNFFSGRAFIGLRLVIPIGD